MSGRTFRKTLLVTLFLLALPVFVSAAVSQISFTTEPQTVKLGEISGTLTFQLQDSSGTSNSATETIDIEFLSSSPTGEFLSPSSGNPVTKTISTGSANKNFRYRDSTEGVFTLTVNAKGRVSGATWTTSQNITVSNLVLTTTTPPNISTSTQSQTVGTTTQATTTSSQTSINHPVAPRAGYTHTVYYSSAPLSVLNQNSPLEVSAGRDRLGTTGSPMEFKAQTNLPYTKNARFKWNFGDGTQVDGEVIVHSYEYPGEYVVMLNASSPEGQAVARANVKVIVPDLEVVLADEEKIVIKNNLPQEVSLFGRVLWAQGNSFVFPQDTIVMGGQAITLSSKITSLRPRSLHEVHLLVIGEVEPGKIEEKIEESKVEEIAYLENQLATLQSQLTLLSLLQPPAPQQSEREEVTPSLPLVAEESGGSSEQIAGAVESGWWELIKSFFLTNKK